jgi:hypothetical protein
MISDSDHDGPKAALSELSVHLPEFDDRIRRRGRGVPEVVDGTRPATSARASDDRAVQDSVSTAWSVERDLGYLKHEGALLPLRVRRIHRVKLHVDLTILRRLAVALEKAHGASSQVAA